MNFVIIFLNELCIDKYKNQNIYAMCVAIKNTFIIIFAIIYNNEFIVDYHIRARCLTNVLKKV